MLRTAIAAFVGVLIGAAVVGLAQPQALRLDAGDPARLDGAVFPMSAGPASGKYPWLPEDLRRRYVPSVAEWQALQLDADDTMVEHEHLTVIGRHVSLMPQGLSVMVICDYEKGDPKAWDNLSERLKRQEFLTIGYDVRRSVEKLLPGIPPEHVVLAFSIRGRWCSAAWHQEKVYLPVDPGFPERAYTPPHWDKVLGR